MPTLSAESELERMCRKRQPVLPGDMRLTRGTHSLCGCGRTSAWHAFEIAAAGASDPRASRQAESAVSDSADSAGPAHSNCPERKQPSKPPSDPPKKRKKSGCRPRNYSWAELMRRVWAIDVLECPRCKGRMRILCAIHPPDAIRKILECLRLPTRPPPLAPAMLEDSRRFS
jgi:hypothetical protein